MPGQSGYAVGWGTLALINAGLAQGKGRSGLFVTARAMATLHRTPPYGSRTAHA